jgi:ubiquinone/menaquinone biosynthesis C-methylase UbiE
MSKLTKNTANFYDRYPFPQQSDHKILKFAEKQNSYLLGLGIPTDFLNKPIKLLDAGCGTGSFALSFALANPKSEVTAINISQSSLDYAKNQAKSLNVENVNFIKADIFKMPDEIINQKYDIVYTRGVLMTTSDPKLGINILSKLVKLDSYMIVGLYHKGRYKVRLMRLVLKLLAGNNAKRRIELARKLFPKHCHHHITKSYENEHLSRENEDVLLADKFAVPKESYHSFVDTNTYLRKLGFKNIYKNVSKPEKRIRREKLIHKIISFLPLSKPYKDDLADDLIGLTVGKEMFLVLSQKVAPK